MADIILREIIGLIHIDRCQLDPNKVQWFWVRSQPTHPADRNHFDRLQPATFSELELGQSRYRGQGLSPSV